MDKKLEKVLSNENKALLHTLVAHKSDIEKCDIDKIAVYKTNSGYTDRFKLYIGKESYSLNFYDDKKVLVVSNKEKSFESFDKSINAKVLKDIVKALDSDVSKIDLGTIHDPKKHSKVSLWNFYNYKIYYQK